jgi:hypothetical protein
MLFVRHLEQPDTWLLVRDRLRLEEGNAIIQKDDEMKWLYIVQQQNPELLGSKITAVATDLPGNIGSMIINC